MKFICNNCGFSAEVPDRRSNCPMCASTNVSVSALTENTAVPDEKKKDEKTDIPNVTQQPVQPVVPEKKVPVENTEKLRKERITLSDDFFDSKPNKEEQEIANILKELYPEPGEGKTSRSLPVKAIYIGIAVVAVLVVAAFFAFSSGDKEKIAAAEEGDNQVANAETGDVEEEIADEAVVEEEKIEEKVEEKVAEKIEEKPIEKVEEKVEEKIEIKKEVVMPKPVEKPIEKPVQKPKPEIVKKPVKKVAEAPQKAPVKQPVAKKDGGNAFANFVQAGHKALSEKKYTDALHEYKNASRINPSNGPIYKFLGIAYAYLQNQEQACVNYKKYIQLSPNAPDKEQVEAFIKACP